MDQHKDNKSIITIDNQEIQVELPEYIKIEGFSTVNDVINGIIKIQEKDKSKTLLSVNFVDGMLNGEMSTPDTDLKFKNNQLINE